MHLIINCCYKPVRCWPEASRHEGVWEPLISSGFASVSCSMKREVMPCTRWIKQWPQTVSRNVASRAPYAPFTCSVRPAFPCSDTTPLCLDPVDLQRTLRSSGGWASALLEREKKKWTLCKETCEFPCKRVKEMSPGAEQVERMHWFTLIL